MMHRLPPPPRFDLPPPPMLTSDIFDMKLLVQLTCSSIRQQEQRYQIISKSRLIAISCTAFLIMIFLFIVLFLIIKFCRQRKSVQSDSESKSSTTIQSNSVTISINNSQSYETISSINTGIYIESVNTSATTFSTDPSHTICLHCHPERNYSTTSSPPYYHTLDILPS